MLELNQFECLPEATKERMDPPDYKDILVKLLRVETHINAQELDSNIDYLEECP